MKSPRELPRRHRHHPGDFYVSTEAIDPASGRIELRSHPATDFVRVELKPGREPPDFAFTDLDGGRHRLSELRGRYVLLDFWSVTCAPCIAELPNLKAAYQTYRERGLEMIGMVMQDDRKKAAPFVAQHGLPWPWASWESIKDVAENRFGILAAPRVILLDPERKIVSTGQPGQLPLRDTALLQSLGGPAAAPEGCPLRACGAGDPWDDPWVPPPSKVLGCGRLRRIGGR